MNIGRLSNENDDGEGNQNVPSYEDECVFFFNFFAFISTFLKSQI